MSAEAKHTPGPWTVDSFYNGSRTICQMRSPDKLVCVNAAEGASPAGYAATEANAYLFAASPDLLAACKARLAADEQIESAATDIDLIAARRARDEANELMRQAIDKAEVGEA